MAADAADQNIKTNNNDNNNEKSVRAQRDGEMSHRGGCVWRRHLTEKFQRVSANTSSLEERGEAFLSMCALLKIPRRDRDNYV